MSDERKSVDTVRPPEGDEDVYSASTKVGEAAPEILALVRKAEADAAMKAPRVPSDMATPPEAENAPPHADVPSEGPTSGDARAALEAASDVAPDSSSAAGAEPAEKLVERTEQGIPPLSLLVLAVAAVLAMWLGFQAMHAPAPTPVNAPLPGLSH